MSPITPLVSNPSIGGHDHGTAGSNSSKVPQLDFAGILTALENQDDNTRFGPTAPRREYKPQRTSEPVSSLTLKTVEESSLSQHHNIQPPNLLPCKPNQAKKSTFARRYKPVDTNSNSSSKPPTKVPTPPSEPRGSNDFQVCKCFACPIQLWCVSCLVYTSGLCMCEYVSVCSLPVTRNQNSKRVVHIVWHQWKLWLAKKTLLVLWRVVEKSPQFLLLSRKLFRVAAAKSSSNTLILSNKK